MLAALKLGREMPAISNNSILPTRPKAVGYQKQALRGVKLCPKPVGSFNTPPACLFPFALSGACGNGSVEASIIYSSGKLCTRVEKMISLKRYYSPGHLP